VVLLLHSPLKRYLYTSLRFFFGMSILSDAGRSSETRRLEANSTPLVSASSHGGLSS
jgi:hypothetical protein